MSNPWEDYIDLDALREDFEASINEEARIYNLVRQNDGTYFSLHTERAWKVFQLGARAALKGISR